MTFYFLYLILTYQVLLNVDGTVIITNHNTSTTSTTNKCMITCPRKNP